VPDLLRALVDPSGASPKLLENASSRGCSVRDEAMYVLCRTIFSGGSVYEASPFVVPFPVEILRDGPPNVPLRGFILSYLHHLVKGNWDLSFPMERGAWEQPDEHTRADDAYHAACAESIGRALAEIVPFVEDADEDLALEAIALLDALASRALVVPHVRRIVSSSENARAAHACMALARIAGTAALEEAVCLARASDRRTSVLGACAAIVADAEEAGDFIVELLTLPLGEAGRQIAPPTSNLSVLVGRCVERLYFASRHRARATVALVRLNQDADWITRGMILDPTRDGPQVRVHAHGCRVCAPEARHWRSTPRWRWLARLG
jgi:hypothetical protein